MANASTSAQPLHDTALVELGASMAIFDPLRIRVWSELGLTTAQLRVLFDIRQTPGVTAGELATKLAVTPPTVSGIVDRLVRFELVERQEDPSDRRLVRNVLTEKGETTCSRFQKGAATFTRRILREMDEVDVQALVRGLAAMRKASEFVATVVPDLAVQAMPTLET